MLIRLDPRCLLACCVRCGLRGGALCRDCAAVPPLVSCTPAGLPVSGLGPYTGHLADCVRRLKYHDETHLAFPLGRALRELACVGADTVIVPVPLHPLRLAERGYNQSALIGRHLASRQGARLVTGMLFRTQAREAQAQLTASERRSNLDGAFVAKSGRRAAAKPRIILLDDVVTTGSTADACAHALAEIGLCVLCVLACAVTEHPRAHQSA